MSRSPVIACTESAAVNIVERVVQCSLWHLSVILMAPGVYGKYHTCTTNSGDIIQSVSILIDGVVVSINMARQLAVTALRKLEIATLKRDTRSLSVSMSIYFLCEPISYTIVRYFPCRGRRLFLAC